MPNQKEKVTFPPGTVVLQAVNDDERCVAVVVGNHMADRLTKAQRALFERHLENDDLHILLVLSYFKANDDRWSIFAQSGAFQFPTYIIERKETATKADLSKEIELVVHHENESPSRGLCYSKLHALMFGFTKKQREALQLIVLVEHYLKGENAENAPDWAMGYSSNKKIIFDELSVACPL